MKYVIENMWFDKVRLDRTSEEHGKNSQYELSISCSMDFNATDMQSVRFKIDFSLHSTSNFTLTCEHYTIIKFAEKLTGEEAEDKMVEIDVPSLLYPYVRSYATNLLISSGFKFKHLPLVVFEKD